jgi:hypothetical protein
MKFMPNGSKNKKFVANRHTYAKNWYNVANVANEVQKWRFVLLYDFTSPAHTA